jgi:hypothetical protein
MKNIGIIDADLLDNKTRHPNIALMKISGFMKNQNNKVELIDNYKNVENYDKVYISKVFSFTNIPIDISKYTHIEIGGTGFFSDGGENLPYEIEHHMPDYTLYDNYIEKEIARGIKKSYFLDYLNYSIGFATRGCFRKCSFCVNKKYNKCERHADINEFLDASRKYIYLWDDNILAFEGWKDVFDELAKINKPFQFRQGIDIRLLTDEKARIICGSKYRGDMTFAFDNIEDKEMIVEKIRLFQRYYHKKGNIRLYLLCAYDRHDKYDDDFWLNDIINTFERIRILMKLKCLPYIMRYDTYKNSPFSGMYTQLARWCNQPQFFKKKSFRQFCIANQEYHKTPNTFCSAYKAMIDFEKNYPEIAKEFFDLRY